MTVLRLVHKYPGNSVQLWFSSFVYFLLIYLPSCNWLRQFPALQEAVIRSCLKAPCQRGTEESSFSLCGIQFIEQSLLTVDLWGPKSTASKNTYVHYKQQKGRKPTGKNQRDPSSCSHWKRQQSMCVWIQRILIKWILIPLSHIFPSKLLRSLFQHSCSFTHSGKCFYMVHFTLKWGDWKQMLILQYTRQHHVSNQYQVCTTYTFCHFSPIYASPTTEQIIRYIQ